MKQIMATMVHKSSFYISNTIVLFVRSLHDFVLIYVHELNWNKLIIKYSGIDSIRDNLLY